MASLATIRVFDHEHGDNCRCSGGTPLPVPTVGQLRAHRDRFTPRTKHRAEQSLSQLQSDHRVAVKETAAIYGVDMAETVSKDAIVRRARRRVR